VANWSSIGLIVSALASVAVKCIALNSGCQFGALTNRKATSSNRAPSLSSLIAFTGHSTINRNHSISRSPIEFTTTRLYYHYIGIRELG